MTSGNCYTPEQIAWLRDNRPTMQGAQLAAEFNALFKTSISEEALKTACVNRGIYYAGPHRFKKGMTTWNKGIKGYMGANRTSFVNGSKPPNHKPIGTERMTVDGYIEVKTEEGLYKWRLKQRVVWEREHGPLARSQVVIFLDNDKTNCDISNLFMVTRGELATLNKHEKFGKEPPEIKKALIAVIKLEQAAKKKQQKDVVKV